ncbi:tRNA 2-thiouridine(34) synthase MnmA [Nitratidesulfovibrio vulgaris]|uniref:tRNA-specific 2-thiouridylase MnmA n=1 Tax=Nitratidesulfovibrio vulgaris (strain DP4) TaxID=391774 RepID=MNMA_NITV4|nr:tRNA 2-thiouridine(34) synthase MnmA [Nitratidesulfovibrio vulgaris]A1VFH0.1 RecName: Full=tRNA-specific 2-thiouridylase MnmA [Nitratidesulfovibrio vulgaris DP4]ABM29186.1 tRNA (5-methylaminomethyl-2-thiouridylate)-methyltransferase [Nitratidesulfovibrio vulgaris DP4]GEB79826.1 tRNA-specific 2-thiouridylase MnmA [Desulfovibrio desulfuricans]
MTIAVAMSGGTDSLFALVLLKEQGQQVCGLHARFIPPTGHDPVPDIRAMCDRLGVDLHVVDLTEAFEEHVVRPFMEDYMVGRTPNPCARCNATMKFGLLADAAAHVGAVHLATGHYARLLRHPRWGTVLQRGVDPAKDQSYFLSLVPHARLEKAVFPLGNWRKEAVRGELARRSIVPPLPSESQEICFVPDDDYRAFLKNRRVRLPGPGPIVTTRGRKIGSHAGLWQYTEGQRKGLGIAWHEPLYVVGKDMENNMLLVGGREALASPGCVAEEVNLLVPYEDWPAEVAVRIRYRQQPLSARVTLRDGRLYARFREPQPPAARGQVLAVYDMEHHVLGGGVILGPLP